MLIDAHLHLWALARGDYHWLTPDLKRLYRDFDWQDYSAACGPIEPHGAILVQAAPTTAETDWLLAVASRHPRVLGVIGWIDFEQPVDVARLAAIKQQGLVGVRPMLQYLEDAASILSAACAATFATLIDAKLVFDALVRPHQLWIIEELAGCYPDLSIVLDHGGKPAIASGDWQPWADGVAALGRFDMISCKVSGLVTEAGSRADTASLTPYVAHLFQVFGEERLIWGSDWPVVTMQTSLAQWHSQSCDLAASLGIDSNKLFGGNARRLYQLSEPLK